MKRLLPAALFLLALCSQVMAQAQLGAGQVWGNPSGAEAPGKSSTLTAMFDQAFGSTSGGILQRGASWGLITVLPVANGGTGGTSQATARTGLGLGSMSTQSAGAVAITGGTITGLPTPVNPSDAARLQDVSAAASGVVVIPQSTLATAAVLPNTPTYANGTAGVGATLTAGANSTLTVDGVVAALNAVVLVKNQASAFQNGVYTVTTAGSGGAAWVLTRATYFDQSAEMVAGSTTFITSGSTNTGSSFTLQAVVTTVGTTSANFNQSFAAGITSLGGLIGTVPIGHGLKTSGNSILVDASFFGNYISGLTLSTAGSSATFSVSVGVAADSTNADLMKLASAFTKTTSAWAVGTGNGALDTGSIAILTWYHVFLMERPDTGVIDICVSVTLAGCTTGGSIPAAYTLFRRIGSMRTNGASQWTLFTQNGDEFIWSVPVNDVSVSNQSTTAVLRPLTVAPGLKVNAMIRGFVSNASTAVSVLISSPDEASSAVNTPSGNRSATNASAGTSGGGAFTINVRTDTSGQIRTNAVAASTTINVATYGWIDLRGKNN